MKRPDDSRSTVETSFAVWMGSRSTDGRKGLRKALAELDPVRYLRPAGEIGAWRLFARTFFPDQVLNAIKDDMAESGLTEDDLNKAIEKLQPTKH
jgi:hypothetical protein